MAFPTSESSDVVLYADDTEIHASSQEVNFAEQCIMILI